MGKSVMDAHECLWHYTTADGLLGIVKSQELWATSIKFLNDREEFSGFFGARLQSLIADGVNEGVERLIATEEGKRRVDAAGGRGLVQQGLLEQLATAICAATLKLEPFVVSFCTVADVADNDGLLSQWRGYGHDGGYAIVFDARALDKLLQQEQEHWLFAFGHWGDVDYGGKNSVVHDETREWEALIRSVVAGLVPPVFEGAHTPNSFEALFDPVVSLATRQKHGGFREEAEVRIVIVNSDVDTVAAARARDDSRSPKLVELGSKGGLLVPRVSLFNRPDGSKAVLPIQKVVVGPHPDRVRRSKGVEALLARHEVDAPVVTSEIPFIGR